MKLTANAPNGITLEVNSSEALEIASRLVMKTRGLLFNHEPSFFSLQGRVEENGVTQEVMIKFKVINGVGSDTKPGVQK